MAKLAIKGNKIREEEVIEILAMVGGSNPFGHSGNNPSVVYYIANKYKNFIICADTKDVRDCIIFTLEGFLEKFPYKVGDRVSSKYLKNYKIEKAEWDSHSNKVVYKLQGVGWHSVEDLQPYKEETMEEQKKDYEEWVPIDYIEFEDNEDTWADEVEVNLGKNYEIRFRGSKTFIVKKKPQYPKTLEKCCEIVGTLPHTRNGVSGYASGKLWALQKLLICRDAYWKIAGEQMGLGKPWEPDFTDFNEERYGLYTQANKIVLDAYGGGDVNTILTFPTEEMRDAFYENFKDLIEECKEFL